ncbi:hypothetical protein GCM10011316_11770 [Roseibium aquae]|uniref:Uncharacterized protein n=1 Tax=Roseibium aquae TaxID=1323746 RepID=A0A916TEK4_9HYPH|nr:hypothetical protein [Roseibium aquae]GGB41473.1 hypothetical protein GCM10011316_11770 [Roseibium aquae]
MRSSLTIVMHPADLDPTPRSGTDRGRFLCFSPDAAVVLRETGAEVLEASDILSSCSHARTLIRSDRILSLVDERLSDAGWHPGDVQSVRLFLFYLLPPVLLIRQCLNSLSDDHYTLLKNGNPEHVGPAAALLERLAQDIARGFDALLPSSDYSDVHARLALWINRIILWRLGKRPHLLQLDLPTPFTSRVARTIAEGRNDAAILSTGHPGKTILATLRRGLRSIRQAPRKPDASKPVRLFRASMRRPAGSLELSLPTPLTNDPDLDRILAPVLAHYLPRLLKDCRAGADLAHALTPDLLVLDHLIQPSVIRAERDLAAKGIPSIMINHGSDTAQDTPVSNLGATFWARHGRVNAPSVKHLFCKSPLTAPLAQKAYPSAPAIHAIEVGKRYSRRPKDGAPFQIVMAGNYRIAEEHVPWVTELPGEFLHGLLEFARAAARVDAVKLVIKIKPGKTGLPLDWLRQELTNPRYAGRVMVDTQTPLGRFFETMDLLVGNNSATIQEALNNRIPVFLNTLRRHYHHVPARMIPPTSDDRAPAYAVRHLSDLPGMIAALRDCHQTPLSDREIEGLVWTDAQVAAGTAFLHAFLDRRDQPDYKGGGRNGA